MSDVIFMHQNSTGRIELEISPSSFLVRPFGSIDEDSDFSMLLWAVKKLGKSAPKVIFDMTSLISITQAGTEKWRRESEQLGRYNLLVYRNLKECFLEAINANPTILGPNSQPESFEAPYFCTQCNQETYIQLNVKDLPVQEGKIKAPQKHCTTCKTEQKFSWLESDYFNFLLFWDRTKNAINQSGSYADG